MADYGDAAGWEKQQMKTFTAWVNMYLQRSKDVTPVVNIVTDFSEGIRLIKLLDNILEEMNEKKQQELGRTSLKKYNKNPRMEIQKIENLNKPLALINQFCKDVGIKISIAAEDVVAGEDRRVILGMVWILISKFAIEDISEEQATAKEGLLLWCKKKTKGYKGCKVTNFGASFQDGLAFAALIHKHRPDLIDYDALQAAGDPLTTLNTAFDVAEREFGICKLLDADDMVAFNPDEKSVMTYVAYYWKAFQQYAQAEVAARRVGNMVARERALDEKRINFEEDSAALKQWIDQKTAFYAACDVGNTSEEIASSLAGLKGYQETEKPPMGAEKTRVDQNYKAFQARLKAENRPPYTAPPGLAPHDLDKIWMGLALAEREYERACRIKIAELTKAEAALKSFGLKVDNLIAWADKKKQYCDEDVPTDSLEHITVASKKHKAFAEEKDAYMQFVSRTQGLAEKLRPGLSDTSEMDGKLAELEAAFAALDDASSERVARMDAEIKRQEELDEQRMIWVQQAAGLVLKIEDTTNELSGLVAANSIDELEALQAEFTAYKAEAGGGVKAELEELSAFTSQLTTLGVTENQYAQYTYDEIVLLVEEMDAAFDARESQIAEEADRQQFLESIRIEFAEHAKAFLDKLEETNSGLTATYGEQLQSAKAASKDGATDADTLVLLTAPFNDFDFAELDSLMEQIVDCNEKLIEYKVGDNPHSSHTANELALEYQNTRDTTIKYAEDIERIMASSTDTSLTDEELSEMQSVFKHFDKDKSGSLGVHEVMAALRAVDVELELSDAEAIIAKYDTSGSGTLEWDEFVQVVVEQRTDTDTPEQIQESFKELAQNRDTITEEQLRQMMDPADAEYLLSKLKPNEDGGYDYKTFVNVAYGKQDAPADYYTKTVSGLTPRARGSTISTAPAPAPAPRPAPAPAPAPTPAPTPAPAVVSDETEVTPTPAVEAESTGIYDTMMYVTEEEEASEELDMATVAKLVEQGVIEADTLCWTEGMDEWMPFEDCSHLFIWPES